MPFPRKFKHLLEPDPAAVPKPDYLWLAYAVCATDASACGWAGWMTEAIFGRSAKRFPTSTGDELLDSARQDTCPRCGRVLFRTGIAIRCAPSLDQSPPAGQPGIAYDVRPLEYE